MKKKKIIIIVIVVLFILMLMPIPTKLKDGGSVSYNAILYKYTKVNNRMGKKGRENGWELEIIGIPVANEISIEE